MKSLIKFKDRVDFEVSLRRGLLFYRSYSLSFSVAFYMYILALFLWTKIIESSLYNFFFLIDYVALSKSKNLPWSILW